MLKIRLAQAAENDLEEIWICTLSEWGENQAEKYMALIQRAISQLLEHPYLGKARPDVKRSYRALQVEKHVVFYSVGDEIIDILGIPHIRMDAKLYFESE
jgi:toxin ParE1/3/4